MEECYYHWLYNIEGIGSQTLKKIVSLVSPRQIYEEGTGILQGKLSEKKLAGIEKKRKEVFVKEPWERLKREGITLAYYGSLEYPKKLYFIPDPPMVLYHKGRKDLWQKPSVAVVGARNCSSYGKQMAQRLGRELARNHITVISGMARGVDGICQWASMEAGGISIGVLGCGVQICYPPENKVLYHRLQNEGGILSESLPYTAPSPGLFPRRNRLISGLADLVVVVEAREKSGTLITVDMALEQGKEVYCVPGRTTDDLSKGCNNLIKMGAGLILSVEQFVEEICPQLHQQYVRVENTIGDNLKPEEKQVLEVLEITPVFIEDIWGRLQAKNYHFSFTRLLEVLVDLQLKEKVAQQGQNYYLQ